MATALVVGNMIGSGVYMLPASLAPYGWNVIRHEVTGNEPGPSEDDLMAIADAVREVALKSSDENETSHIDKTQSTIGRRGHLRAIPS